MHIEPTNNTPLISFDSQENKFEISGVSIPEDTPLFYKPVFELFESFIDSKPSSIDVVINLIHFNSSSSKALFTLFKIISRIKNSIPVSIVWICDTDDEDMIEIIEDYDDVLDLGIEIKEIQPVS